MGVVVFYTGDFLTAFHKEFVIVQVAGITGDTVVITHIDGFGHLFTGHQCFVQFLSVTGTDNPDISSTMVQLFQCISQDIQGSGRSFLNKQVTVMAVLESIQHQVYGIIQSHHETGHVGVRYSNRIVFLHLFHP